MQINDWFGYSLDLDGNYLAVGAPFDAGYRSFNAGAVYIFKRSGNSWSLEYTIYDRQSGFTALQSGDVFGFDVSLDGDRLAVGAYYDDGYDGLNTGAVYIFKRSGSIWNLEAEISDQKTGFTALAPWDTFGNSVRLDGDRLAVSALLDDGL